MLYRANFDSEINYLKKSFQTLQVWLTFNSFFIFDLLMSSDKLTYQL
jgi:hypothetical protein